MVQQFGVALPPPEHSRFAAALRDELALSAPRVGVIDRIARRARDARDRATWLAARQAIAALEPQSTDAWSKLGYVRREHFDMPGARDAYERAIALDPVLLPACFARLNLPPAAIYPDRSTARAYLDEWLVALDALMGLPLETAPYRAQAEAALAQATNFYLHYLYDEDVAPQRRHGALISRLARVVASATPVAQVPAPRDGRRRIVFVSTYFRDHVVARLFANVIAKLDRSRLQVYVLQLGERDAVTDALRTHCDHLLAGGFRLPEWIALLRGLAPDAIVYAELGMHPLPLALAALRLAPVQACLWGHPVTTGLDTIDAFLSNDVFESPGGERNYSERLVRLPGLGAYFEPLPRDDSSDARAAPVHGDETLPSEAGRDAPLCLLPSSHYKLMPEFDDLVARVAARVPALRFTAFPSAEPEVCKAYARRVAAAFERHGVDPARIAVRPTVAWSEFARIANRADFWLDTPGWSGGMTALDLFHLGLPAIALEGSTFRARQTAALLRHAGADALVARDADDYVERAVQLAESADLRARVRRQLSERSALLHRDARMPAALSHWLVEQTSGRAS